MITCPKHAGILGNMTCPDCIELTHREFGNQPVTFAHATQASPPKPTLTPVQEYELICELEDAEFGLEMDLAMDGSGDCGPIIHESHRRFLDEIVQRYGYASMDAYEETVMEYAVDQMVAGDLDQFMAEPTDMTAMQFRRQVGKKVWGEHESGVMEQLCWTTAWAAAVREGGPRWSARAVMELAAPALGFQGKILTERQAEARLAQLRSRREAALARAEAAGERTTASLTREGIC